MRTNKVLVNNLFLLYCILLFFNFSIEVALCLYAEVQPWQYYLRLLPAPLMYLIFPLLFPRILRLYALGLSSVFFVFVCISMTHILLYGADVPHSAYYAIWETNINEASSYIGQYVNFQILTAVFFILIPVVCLYLLMAPYSNLLSKYFFTRVIIAVLLFGASYYDFAYVENVPNKYAANYLQYRKEVRRFIAEIEKRKNFKREMQSQIVCASDKPLTIVVIIGESASRYHHSLYGYARETNPLLKSIQDELFIFTDVIAPHAHTNAVMSKVLTFANHDSMDPLYEKRSIVEYMKDAGFKTFWISNQEFGGQFSTIGSSIAVQSDWYVVTGGRKRRDELLFKPFQDVISDSAPRKFIVVHLMGSHCYYKDRYTDSFNVFGDTSPPAYQPFNTSAWAQPVINEYDNSILYTDWVLYKLIQYARAQSVPTFWLYFADHGEELFEYRDFISHSKANASIYMFDIPFIVWLSDEFKEHYCKSAERFAGILDRKYQTDDLIHSIIDISGCYSDDFDASRSIFYADFLPRTRFMGDFNYDELIKTRKSVID